MKPSVYIETTILGHLTSRLPKDQIVRGQMLETRKWWDESRHAFEIFTSDVVINEASRGDPQAAAERLEKIAAVALVPLSDAAVELGLDLIARSALPAKAEVDAYHLGIVATNGINFLLTWNCRHLANATLRRKIEQVCRDRGFEPPIVCTPTEIMEVRS